MGFGKAVFSNMLRNLILPSVYFQLVAIPPAAFFPISGTKPAFVAVEKRGWQFDAGDKYRNMPYPHYKEIYKENLKDGKTFQHPTHLSLSFIIINNLQKNLKT